MGNTIFQTLYLNKSGQELFESFESSNFISDTLWSILRGNPVRSPNTAIDGLYSFIVDASNPYISKQVSESFSSAVGYIFDDATVLSAGQNPVFILDLVGVGSYYGFGIDTTLSTTKYIYYNNGTPVVSSVTRTNGWHRLTLDSTSGSMLLKIDGTTVATLTAQLFNRVRVGSLNNPVTPTPFCYFDDIQLAFTSQISVSNLISGQVVKLYDSSSNLLATATASGAGLALLNVPTNNFPLSCYMRITRKDGVTQYFTSDTLQMFAGDYYFLYVLDFGRRVSTFDFKKSVKRDDKESNSGKNEGIFFNARDVVTVTVAELTNDKRAELTGWFGQAQQSKVYGVAINSEDTINAPTSVDTPRLSTTVTVTDASGIGKGVKLIMKRADNLYFEEVTCVSVAGSVVTINRPLLNTYPAGSSLRSIYFWPKVISTDKNLMASLVNVKKNRWTFTNNFKEAL